MKILIISALIISVAISASAQIITPPSFGPAPTLNSGTLVVPPPVIFPPPSVSGPVVPARKSIPPSIIPLIQKYGKCYVEMLNELTEVDCPRR